jgi:hypothetical protein
LAIEDCRYYRLGVDPIGVLGAVASRHGTPLYRRRQHDHPTAGPQRLPADIRRFRCRKRGALDEGKALKRSCRHPHSRVERRHPRDA